MKSTNQPPRNKKENEREEKTFYDTSFEQWGDKTWLLQPKLIKGTEKSFSLKWVILYYQEQRHVQHLDDTY